MVIDTAQKTTITIRSLNRQEDNRIKYQIKYARFPNAINNFNYPDAYYKTIFTN
jgi:hypothetical protein